MTDEDLEKRFNNFDEFGTEISSTLNVVHRSLQTMLARILELEKHTKMREPKVIVQ